VRPSRSTVLVGGLVLAAVASTPFVRLNLSLSVPLGVYRLHPVQHPLTPGTLVVLPVPASVQEVWPWWVPLLKPVAAVAGEQVCVREEGLWVGERYYGPVLPEAQGHPLPHLTGCVHLREGEVFLASGVARSLDGRYYGPTPVSDLTAQATPLWTWR
jgi:type IV secretory pathway protease TraF